jgi:hypothetical protein
MKGSSQFGAIEPIASAQFTDLSHPPLLCFGDPTEIGKNLNVACASRPKISKHHAFEKESVEVVCEQ